jgi:anti-sigma factor RsiW
MTPSGRPDARCRALLLELSRYLDGELTPARCRAVERHLESCGCCSTKARCLRTTIRACRAARDERLPSDRRQRARARVRALLGEQKRGR